MIISSDVGLLGPYAHIESKGDRIRVWPVGSPETALGADLPLEVIGVWEHLDIELPAGFVADDYIWNGSSLQRKSEPAE